MLFLSGLWARFSGYVVAAVAATITLLSLYFKIKSDGKNEAKLEQFKDQAEDNKKALEVSHRVDIATDNDVDKQLQLFTRDK